METGRERWPGLRPSRLRCPSPAPLLLGLGKAPCCCRPHAGEDVLQSRPGSSGPGPVAASPALCALLRRAWPCPLGDARGEAAGEKKIAQKLGRTDGDAAALGLWLWEGSGKRRYLRGI